MPNVHVSVPHSLGADEAKRRVTALISKARTDMGAEVSDIEETWTGNVDQFRFKAMGFSVSGQVNVQPSSVDVDLNLPFAALPFKSRIERELESRAQELLA